MRRQSNEPLLWLLFSAGGVLAALLGPILILLFGVAFPLGWLEPPEHARLLRTFQNPLVRLILFAFCALSLVHGAHRFRYTLYDGLQIKHLNEFINVLCYGGAIAGSLLAAYILWRVP
jgi:fumarate reductase subunit D